VRRIDVYVDTSVFGGIGDEEFKEASIRFFDLVRRGKYTVLISSITLEELSGAPSEIQTFVEQLPVGSVVEVSLSKDMEDLARAYLDSGVVGKRSRVDALHVAAATIAKADLILSWNFRDIVNYDRIRGFNGVNVLKGYNQIEIRSPLEVYDASDIEDV